MVRIGPNTKLPARREAVTLHTEDGLRLVGELALPADRAPIATVVLLHPLPTHGGMMDSHVLRKAAFRLPALAGLAVLRFNTRGAASEAGRSEGTFGAAEGEGFDVAAALDFVRSRGLPRVWLAGWSFGSDLALMYGIDSRGGPGGPAGAGSRGGPADARGMAGTDGSDAASDPTDISTRGGASGGAEAADCAGAADGAEAGHGTGAAGAGQSTEVTGATCGTGTTVEGVVLIAPPLRWSSPVQRAAWASAGKPVVALVPEFDDYRSPEHVREGCAMIPQARVITLPGAGHLLVGHADAVLDHLVSVIAPETPVPLPRDWDGECENQQVTIVDSQRR